jgi:hypothetical protein
VSTNAEKAVSVNWFARTNPTFSREAGRGSSAIRRLD